MGFTPFKAFVKGGAEFAQKVFLARLEGEYDLRKATGVAKAKADAANVGRLTHFKAGNVDLTFTNSEAKDASARNQGNITDMYTVLGSDNYQKFINAAKKETKGADKIRSLNTFLIGRVQPFIKDSAIEEKIGDAVKIVKHEDITIPYSQSLEKGYGREFMENVVAPSYKVEYERFQRKYPKQLGLLSDKKLTSDGYVQYSHIPYLTQDIYNSEDGRYIIQQANDAAKKLNVPYEKLLGSWQTGTGDELKDVKKQRVIWDVYGNLKKVLPPEGIDLKNIGSYAQFISAARKTAYDSGVSPDQFANMLQTFVPSFSSNDTKPFIYTTSSARDSAIRNEHANHLKDEYKIDPEEAAVKASAANQAAGIAGRMVVEFRKNQVAVGQGTLQPTVSGVAKSIEGFFGSTGIFQGFGNLASWVSDKQGFNKNQVTRNRLQNTLATYQKNFNEKDATGQLTSNARKARIEFMKFNLAYAMASAFQGGTGGRTISDQDIENMMAAMKFEYDSSEDIIIESLQTIQSVMKDVAVIQDGYRKGGKAAGVSYLLEKTNQAFGVDFAEGGNYSDYAIAKLEGKVAKAGKFNVQLKPIRNPKYISKSQTPNVPKFITVPK
tara:strand:+ start:3263 stop:5083 length:1821 start_codon:yes stop_codon:yes gene_type:complete